MEGGIETNNNTRTVLRNRRPLLSLKLMALHTLRDTTTRAYTGFFRGLGPDYIAVTAGAKAHFVNERADSLFVDQK